MSNKRTITCGICGHNHRLYGTQIERKLMNSGRNSGLLYKCKMCSSTLNIIRINNEWKNRWIEAANMKLESPIRKEDLSLSRHENNRSHIEKACFWHYSTCTCSLQNVNFIFS